MKSVSNSSSALSVLVHEVVGKSRFDSRARLMSSCVDKWCGVSRNLGSFHMHCIICAPTSISAV